MSTTTCTRSEESAAGADARTRAAETRARRSADISLPSATPGPFPFRPARRASGRPSPHFPGVGPEYTPPRATESGDSETELLEEHHRLGEALPARPHHAAIDSARHRTSLIVA